MLAMSKSHVHGLQIFISYLLKHFNTRKITWIVLIRQRIETNDYFLWNSIIIYNFLYFL